MATTSTEDSGGPFILTRAHTPNDFDSIVALEFKTFTDPHLREIFMGPDTPDGHAHLSSFYQKTLHTNASDVWVKVEEKKTGKIVGASNWRVHMGSVPKHELAEEDLGWGWLECDEEKLNKVKGVITGIMGVRKRLFTEPYCHYQRRGIGSMMLQWGSDLADQLFLPSWVEASPAGNFLYRKFGYKDIEVNESGEMQGSTMRREARVLSVEGGQ
ncbi:hypothetical protein D6D12_04946 [Aureobasidium pullulans]|uniref:N-acetyltransferase domain-containing protein n=1 Tax=Aureobasidium pullulans TaxID=5580 RepID=A0A4S9E342_AURPU|nr:hypothetical protein D6D12_04946 [Aureobasidium pullulans]THX39114.1 hypothetical protein D6D11_08903 [Aureobasidium pullulans]THX66219.1 hypothetical protein D6D08_07367 [Aureobasidium pullulans]THX74768.1 hypothetical protein D6D04_07763 [Aureobasidium pullulans]